jgi:hypothetical protein
MIALKESILDDIDVQVKRGNNIVKYPMIFDAIDNMHSINADFNNRYPRLKYNQDKLGNDIEPGDIIYYDGGYLGNNDIVSKYGRYALAIGYKDKDEKNIHGSGRLCVIFGYKKGVTRTDVEFSDRWTDKHILNDSKLLVSYWGINANNFILIKKGDKRLAKLLQDVELNKNR